MSDTDLARRLEKLQSILDVAKAMTSERHLDRLLELVVDEAARVAEAMPPERALDILAEEARRGQVDAALLGVFVDAAVWRETARPA